ncbi:MAG: superoxide dismutase [Planctomycetes bacterium]|nr:superoxide dismutase [Planctomycetota bacterium]
MNRRDVLTALPAGAAALAFPELRRERASDKPGTHEIVPLPFDPTKLRGLSEKLIVSHHDNNYAGAVKNLNRVEAELANVTKDTPPFVVAGLKERELTFRNSAALHELYFGNLAGDGKLEGELAGAAATAFGSAARCEELIRATAMALAGGSGWVVLGYDLHRDGLALSWSGGHTQHLAACLPVLVLDMYEHSYHLDYGAAAARYVDAFFANLHGEELNRRLAAARKAAAAMRA